MKHEIRKRKKEHIVVWKKNIKCHFVSRFQTETKNILKKCFGGKSHSKQQCIFEEKIRLKTKENLEPKKEEIKVFCIFMQL